MMKKSLATVLAAVLAMSALTACGGRQKRLLRQKHRL